MSDRTVEYQRNDSLEGLLRELNGALGGAEQAMGLPAEPRRPLVLVVGPPRSGTTLTMQWLAASSAFAYPTNLLSRFYGSPYLGARIQQLLADPRFNYRDELWAFTEHHERFRSDLGKTRGPLEPNEFWYFWRRFIPLVDPEPLAGRPVDAVGLRRALAALETAFDKPFAAKGILFQYDLPLIASLLPKSVFLWTARDRARNAQSFLKARIDYWGDATRWFSVRPPGSERLSEATPEVQVAGQILATERALATDLARIGDDRFLRIEHEAFCAAPGPVWQQLRARLAEMGEVLPEAPPEVGDAFRPAPPLPSEVQARWDRAFDEAARLLG